MSLDARPPADARDDPGASSAPALALDVDDIAAYEAFGRGNAHIVFRYSGPRRELRGALLRARRARAGVVNDAASPWRCHAVDAAAWGVDGTRADWTALDAAARDAFFATAGEGGGGFGRVRDDVGIVVMSADAARALGAKSTAEGGRGTCVAETRGQLSEFAAETCDVFTARDGAECVLIEVKPKSFIGSASAGSRWWRFPAHQRLRVARGETARASEYVPVDLLGDEDDVERACDALLRCPQNNLRVSRAHPSKSASTDLLGDAAFAGPLRRALPKILRDARDVFEFIFRHQGNGGDDDPETFRVVHDVVCELTERMERGEVVHDETGWSRTLELLRRFVLGQMAKDCSVLFTANLDAGHVDEHSRASLEREHAVRFVSYVDDTGVQRCCAYRAQILDASLKSFAKTAAWSRLADDIAAFVRPSTDDAVPRAFVDELFQNLDPGRFRVDLATSVVERA